MSMSVTRVIRHGQCVSEHVQAIYIMCGLSFTTRQCLVCYFPSLQPVTILARTSDEETCVHVHVKKSVAHGTGQPLAVAVSTCSSTPKKKCK